MKRLVIACMYHSSFSSPFKVLKPVMDPSGVQWASFAAYNFEKHGAASSAYVMHTLFRPE